MNARLVSHLFRRVFRLRRVVGTVLLVSFPALAVWAAIRGNPPAAAAGQFHAMAVEQFKAISMTVPALVVPLAVLFMSTGVLRDERDGGTLPFLFVSPVRASTFAVSSWAAALFGSVVIVSLGWAAMWATTGATLGDWGLAVPVLWLYLAAAFAYSAVFVPLGYLFARSLIAGLAYVFVWEAVVVRALPGVGTSSIWRLALSLYADHQKDLPEDVTIAFGNVIPSTVGPLVALTVIAVLGIGLLTWALRRRDAV